MKIIDKLLARLEKNKAKHIQRQLIRTKDDEKVVEMLSFEKDNSSINIKKVVKSMESIEGRAQVVNNNLDEIIRQDNVRDTLKYLNDSSIFEILDKNNGTLKDSQKIKNAIDAMKTNEKKIRAVHKNINILQDIEIADIFRTLKCSKEDSEESKKVLEQQKIKLVALKIMEHLESTGNVWHLKELTDSFDESSKMLLFDFCVISINDYIKKDVKNINTESKKRFVVRFLDVMNLENKGKIDLINQYQADELFSEEEAIEIKEVLQKQNAPKEPLIKASSFGGR